MKVVNIINNIFFPMWVEYTLISNDIHAKKNANNNKMNTFSIALKNVNSLVAWFK
jgi:hypothetical protein